MLATPLKRPIATLEDTTTTAQVFPAALSHDNKNKVNNEKALYDISAIITQEACEKLKYTKCIEVLFKTIIFMSWSRHVQT